MSYIYNNRLIGLITFSLLITMIVQIPLSVDLYTVLAEDIPILLEPMVSRVIEGRSVEIRVITPGAEDLIRIDLFYRWVGKDSVYRYAQMIRFRGNRYKAVIPSLYVTHQGLEYYIEVIDRSGNKEQLGIASMPYYLGVERDKRPCYKNWWCWTVITGIATVIGGYEYIRGKDKKIKKIEVIP